MIKRLLTVIGIAVAAAVLPAFAGPLFIRFMDWATGTPAIQFPVIISWFLGLLIIVVAFGLIMMCLALVDYIING